MLSTELLNLKPNFVVVVATDTLGHVQYIWEVTKVDGSMISKEKVGEFKRAFSFHWIRRIDMIFKSHFHQKWPVGSHSLKHSLIIPQKRVKNLYSFVCKHGVLLETDDCNSCRDEVIGSQWATSFR